MAWWTLWCPSRSWLPRLHTEPMKRLGLCKVRLM
jgi:hypothetical protein